MKDKTAQEKAVRAFCYLTIFQEIDDIFNGFYFKFARDFVAKKLKLKTPKKVGQIEICIKLGLISQEIADKYELISNRRNDIMHCPTRFLLLEDDVKKVEIEEITSLYISIILHMYENEIIKYRDELLKTGSDYAPENVVRRGLDTIGTIIFALYDAEENKELFNPIFEARLKIGL